MQDSVVSHLLLQAWGTQESWIDGHCSSFSPFLFLSIISFYCPSLYFLLTPFLSFPLVYFCSCSLFLSFFYPCRLFHRIKTGLSRILQPFLWQQREAAEMEINGEAQEGWALTFEAFDIKKGSAFLTQLVWYFHSLMWLRIWSFNVSSVNDSELRAPSSQHIFIL